MFWNSPVNKQKEERERFSPPRVVIGIALAFLLILAFLYPEKPVVQVLEHNGSGSPTARHYLTAMLRKQPDNTALRLKLADAQIQAGQNREALATLSSLAMNMAGADGQLCSTLRLAALKGILSSGKSLAPDEKRQLLKEYDTNLQVLLAAKPALPRLRHYLADAQAAGATVSAEKIVALLPAQQQPSSRVPGQASAPPMDYRAQAAVFFRDMPKAASLAERRELFYKGVRMLQSGNLLNDALAEADRNIDGLANDQAVLVFLTKLALAAGQPDKAQVYVRKALGMTRNRT